MRTVTYQSVLDGLLRSLGQDPSSASTERLAQCAEAIAVRYREAWQYYRWPELLTTEERYFRNTWTAATYAAGAEVWHAATEAYYVTAAGATSGQVPGTATQWALLTGNWHRYVAYEQAGEVAIGAVLAVHDTDPRANPAALRVSFQVTADGITIPPASRTLDSVWLTYRSREEDFGWSSVYSASVAYAVGAVIYAAPHVYLCTATTTAGDAPAATPAKWRALEFPHRFAIAVKAGARADVLGALGQEDKEAARASRFEDVLEEEVWQLTKLQGQTGTPTTIPPL